ncbi:MAG: hypothetical protein WCP59_17485 [Actinomycetota bacterium]
MEWFGRACGQGEQNAIAKAFGDADVLSAPTGLGDVDHLAERGRQGGDGIEVGDQNGVMGVGEIGQQMKPSVEQTADRSAIHGRVAVELLREDRSLRRWAEVTECNED